MSKILITYFTQTGNTKQIAEAIHSSMEEETEIMPVNEVDDMDAYDLIFIGFPVQTHSIPYSVKTLIESVPEGKTIAFFSTHGALTGSRLAREALEYATTLASGKKIIGTFSCRGKVSFQALEVLSQSPEHQAWVEMARSARTHPDAHDIAEAKSFAGWVMTLYHQERS